MREKTKYMSGRSWREKRDEGINMYYIQIAKKNTLKYMPKSNIT